MTNNIGKGLGILVCFGFAATAFHYIISRIRKAQNNNHQINEVLSFSRNIEPELIKNNTRPWLHPSMNRLLHYLNLSRHTVDICMEMITSLDIACQVLDLHHRGVKIRVIVDGDMAHTPACSVNLLEKQKIDVRIATINSLFQNFCIIDASPDIKDSNVTPFTIFGSLTWSKDDLSCDNDEIVFITSRTAIVRLFQEEFDRIYTDAI